jgi:hypothetical protein
MNSETDTPKPQNEAGLPVVPCSACGGSGEQVTPYHPIDGVCHKCRGSGKNADPPSSNSSNVLCPHCGCLSHHAPYAMAPQLQECNKCGGQWPAPFILTDLSAGAVPPGPAHLTVTHTHEHKSLRIGDVVIMRETPRMDNVVIRISDMTIHDIIGQGGQYIHLLPIEVGTPVARRPPRRSRRAELPHRAPRVTRVERWRLVCVDVIMHVSPAIATSFAGSRA